MKRSLRFLVALAVTSASAFPQQISQRVPVQAGFVRWGAEISGSPSNLVLTRIDVDRSTMSTMTVPLPPRGYSQLVDPAAISPDNDSAAIAIPTGGDGSRMVYVLRKIRAPGIGQSTGYLIPERDPYTAYLNYRIVGPPRFLNAQELWVLEGRGDGRVTRLARYRLGPAGVDPLGASDLVDPLHPDPNIAMQDWLIHDGNAVVLQQLQHVNGVGIEVLCYAIDGTVAHRFPVNPNGFTVFQAPFSGIRSVPAHRNWGFMQYSVGTPGRSQARFVNLDSGEMTPELEVISKEGRISLDGTLAHFRDISDPSGNTLLPVRLPGVINHLQPLNTLPPVPGFFCLGGGDSVAADGGYMVTAPSHATCQGNWVRRTRINAAGQLEIVTISTNSGNGPFLFFNDVDGAFNYPGMHRLYNLAGSTGHTLLSLDVPSMTYGTQTLTLSARIFF
jgi:hypothetical protein